MENGGWVQIAIILSNNLDVDDIFVLSGEISNCGKLSFPSKSGNPLNTNFSSILRIKTWLRHHFLYKSNYFWNSVLRRSVVHRFVQSLRSVPVLINLIHPHPSTSSNFVALHNNSRASIKKRISPNRDRLSIIGSYITLLGLCSLRSFSTTPSSLDLTDWTCRHRDTRIPSHNFITNRTISKWEYNWYACFCVIMGLNCQSRALAAQFEGQGQGRNSALAHSKEYTARKMPTSAMQSTS